MTGPRDQLAGVEDLTPPDAVARLTAALGGNQYQGRHTDRSQVPRFPQTQTGLETLNESTAAVWAAMHGEAT